MLGFTPLDPLGEALSDTVPGDQSRLSWVVGRLCGLGIHVTVLSPGSKTPDHDYRTNKQLMVDLAAGNPSKGWYLGTDDVARVRTYLKEAKIVDDDGTVALPNIGVHLGSSNLIAIDVDKPGDVGAWQQTWVSHEGGEPPLMNILSPGKVQDGEWVHHGGGYFLYRVPAGLSLTSARELTKAEQIVAGREGWVAKAGRGVGVLMPPSMRAEGPYVYTDVPIVDAPPWLIALCTPAAPAPPRQRSEFDDEIDAVSENIDWDWALTGIAARTPDDPDGCRVYRRYGGAPKSIVIHNGCESVRGARCVTIHSDSVIGMFPALQDALNRGGRPTGRKSVSWWTFLAAVRFGGDLRAAAECMTLTLPERCGYTPVDLSGMVHHAASGVPVRMPTAIGGPVPLGSAPVPVPIPVRVPAVPVGPVPLGSAAAPVDPVPLAPVVVPVGPVPLAPVGVPVGPVPLAPVGVPVGPEPLGLADAPIVREPRFTHLWVSEPRPHIHLSPCGLCAAEALRTHSFDDSEEN